jgi:hypothetical protein
MHRLILDTNILHQEGLSSRNMQQLGRLVDAGRVEICIPALVRREFLSKRVIETLESLHRVQKDLKDIAKRLEHNPVARDQVRAVDDSVAALRPAIGRELEQSYTTWADLHKIRELAFNPESLEAMLDDYFAGTGAFRKPKSREDLIDAMIDRAIRNEATDDVQLFVALQDGHFRNHLLSLGNLQVLPSVAAYLELEEVRRSLAELNSAAEWQQRITARLEEPDFQEFLRTYLKSLNTDLLAFVYLEENDIDGSEELAVQPLWGLRLNGISADVDTVIDFDSATFDGERSFSIGIEVTGVGQVDYAADYADYYSAGEDSDSLTLVSMDGDGACDIREQRTVVFNGYLGIALKEAIQPDMLREVVERGDADVDLTVLSAQIVA